VTPAQCSLQWLFSFKLA